MTRNVKLQIYVENNIQPIERAIEIAQDSFYFKILKSGEIFSFRSLNEILSNIVRDGILNESNSIFYPGHTIKRIEIEELSGK